VLLASIKTDILTIDTDAIGRRGALTALSHAAVNLHAAIADHYSISRREPGQRLASAF